MRPLSKSRSAAGSLAIEAKGCGLRAVPGAFPLIFEPKMVTNGSLSGCLGFFRPPSGRKGPKLPLRGPMLTKVRPQSRRRSTREPFQKVGGFAPTFCNGLLGPPGPPRHPTSTISGRPKHHVFKTQAGQTLRGLKFIVYLSCFLRSVPKHNVPTMGLIIGLRG